MSTKKLNNKIPTITNHINDYFAIFICFLLSIIVLEIVNVFLLSRISENSFLVFAKALFNNVIVSCFFSIVLFVVYFLLKLIYKKIAFFVTAFLFSFLLFSEIGLTIYTKQTGSLMGSELLIRPLVEVLITIKASMGIWQSVLIVIGVIAGFITVSYFVAKIKFNKWLSLCLSVIIIVFATMLPIYLNASKNTINCSKTFYFIDDVIKYSKQPVTESIYKYDDEKIKQFLSYNSGYDVPDIEYPMERTDNIPDVLSPYFELSDKAPNIVMIVIESFGIENIESPCSVPYIDSLSKHSLYWSNCLSSTKRSFGAVPSLTGSLPSPKGFQFGNMPEHNSLISILKANEYQTNAFYAGEFTFDCIYEYLNAQGIDYLSPFWHDFQNEGDNKWFNGTYWGYHDGIMFDKSISILKEQPQYPKFNLFVTISTHEDLDLNIHDKNKQQYYIDKADNFISKNNIKARKERYAGMLYIDDCLRKFMNDYSKLPEYENTIFIITGDHASGYFTKNELSFYHVPLIIWSPMLKQTAHFKSMVTHNDLAPSLVAFMKNNYGIELPYVHWVGDGLDTSSNCNLNKIMPIISQSRDIKDFIYKNYFYMTSIDNKPSLYSIDKDMNLTLVENDSIIEDVQNAFEIYKYIFGYVYNNDKLTKNAIQKQENFTALNKFYIPKMICKTPQYKPSEVGVNKYELVSRVDIPDNHKKVRVIFDGVIEVSDGLDIDEYMDINFDCITLTKNTHCTDRISKFFSSPRNSQGQYEINIIKEFILDEEETFLTAYISTAKADHWWVKDSYMTIYEATITIEGTK